MNSVKWYETGLVTVPIHFPEGKRSCKYCWLFCRYERDFNRYSCKLTDEWLEDIERGVGKICPLEFKGD